MGCLRETCEEGITVQKDRKNKKQEYGDLSPVWQELLGGQANQPEQPEETDLSEKEEGATAIPTLESDPWSRLLHAKGIEMVDLEQLHLHMSEQDVEEMLAIMREQSAQANDEQSSES
jgi:hypothetical protein